MPSCDSGVSTAAGPSTPKRVQGLDAHLQQALALRRERGADPVDRERRQPRPRPDDGARTRAGIGVRKRAAHHGSGVALELLRDGLEVGRRWVA